MRFSRALFFHSRKQSSEALFLVRRCSPSKAFHSSSYLRSAQNPDTHQSLLAQERVSSRSWRSYLIPTVVLGGIGGMLYTFHKNDEKRAIRKGQGAKDDCSCSTFKGPTIGGPFSLIDSEGRLVTEKDLRGDWVLLYFGYTSSPDVGPAELQKLAKAISILDSQQNIKVRPVFVTLDPQRDNPYQLRAYLGEFDKRIMGLTGPVAAVRQVANEYRVYFKKIEEDGDDYLVDSSHNMYLMSPNLEVVKCFGVEYNAEQLSEAIQEELEKKRT